MAMLLSAPNARSPAELGSQSEASGCLFPPALMYSRFTSGISTAGGIDQTPLIKSMFFKNLECLRLKL